MTSVLSRRNAIAGSLGVGLSMGVVQKSKAQQTPAPGIQRLHPTFDDLIEPDSTLETIMEGSIQSEGPVWIGGRDGHLLFSDVPGNVMRRWSARDGVSEFLRPSGYAGPPTRMLRAPGSNGMILARGAVVMADSGNRGLARLDLRTRSKKMLCRDFEGRRFNSPNDLVLSRDGSIYFTDPPYGLTGLQKSPWREMDYTGIFRLAPDGAVSLLDRSVPMPNGIGLSPDGRTLYASALGIGWLAWTLDAQGHPTDRRTFIDQKGVGVSDGDSLKIDAAGNMWAGTREGLNVFNPEGKGIGLISTGGAVTNCEFGADGYLYITGGPRVVRTRVRARKLTAGRLRPYAGRRGE